MQKTPAERLAWREHFQRFPPGDFYSHKLLTDLVSMLGSFLSGKHYPHQQIAPWLYNHPLTGEKTKEIPDPTPDEDLVLKSLQAIVDENDAS